MKGDKLFVYRLSLLSFKYYSRFFEFENAQVIYKEPLFSEVSMNEVLSRLKLQLGGKKFYILAISKDSCKCSINDFEHLKDWLKIILDFIRYVKISLC